MQGGGGGMTARSKLRQQLAPPREGGKGDEWSAAIARTQGSQRLKEVKDGALQHKRRKKQSPGEKNPTKAKIGFCGTAVRYCHKPASDTGDRTDSSQAVDAARGVAKSRVERETHTTWYFMAHLTPLVSYHPPYCTVQYSTIAHVGVSISRN